MDPTVGTFAGSIALTEDSLIPTEDSLIPTEDIPPASDNILARFTVGITGPAQTIPLLHRSAVVDAFGGAELNVLNRGGVLCRPRLRCGISIRPLSALGQKRTSRGPWAMSALPPEADKLEKARLVRFVPNADIRAPSDHVPSNSNAHLNV